MVSLKYAVVERERRFLVAAIPDGVREVWEIEDRYVDGSRLRLREVRKPDGSVQRKLGHKVRVSDGPSEVACTSVYLDDSEWALLTTRLPATTLRKRRHHVHRDGLHVVVDELEDGTLLAEIDDGDGEPADLPGWLEVVADVSDDEAWTGVALASGTTPTP
jgi:CYTH domain-containing protein